MISYRCPILILLVFVLWSLLSCDKKKRREALVDIAHYSSLMDKGEVCHQQQHYDSAFYYFNQAKLEVADAPNTDRTVDALIRMSALQQISSDFSGSEVTTTEALKYLPHTTRPAYPAIIYNTLGIAYKGQYDYENAVRYYTLAAGHTRDLLYQSIIKNNIAVVYLEKNDYKSAIQLLEPLTHSPSLTSDAPSYAKAMDNLGYAYLKTGNPKALASLKISLAIREKLANDYELVPVYLHLSEYYREADPDLSRAYAEKSYVCATRVNSTDDRIEALKTLIADTPAAVSKRYAVIRMHLTDSIGRVRQASKSQFAKIRYDFSKAHEENLKLRLESEQDNERTLLLTSGLVALLLLSLGSYFLIRAHNKRQQLNTAYETETRIARKLHDELANDVFNTMAFAQTQDLSTSGNKETLLTTLDAIYSQTRNISKENSAIHTGPDFVAHLKEMILGYTSNTINVLVNGIDSLDWTAVTAPKKVILYRIIQELLVNMKKHSRCTVAVITFRETGRWLLVDYSDNGIGRPSDEINLKNGLHNVENRIEAIKGRISFDTKSQVGFKLSFSFPI